MSFLCPICDENNYPAFLGCHTICDHCLSKLQSDQCPICRTTINYENVSPLKDLMDHSNREKRLEDFWNELWVRNLIAKIKSRITPTTIGVYMDFGTGVGEVAHLLQYIAEQVDLNVMEHREETGHYQTFMTELCIALDGLYLLIIYEIENGYWDIDKVKVFIIKLIYAKINRECYLDLE